MAKELEHINVVFIGHVDHGKSTSVGRLVYDAGAFDAQKMAKLEQLAKENGKVGFEFAYIMDNLKEEQERGVTIDLSHMEFKTDKFHFTIIDAPGHKDFIKNMITGASQADAAVLVVAANDGINAQTREHAFLAKVQGIEQITVLVNKMDLQDYKEDRFNAVKAEVEALLKGSGFQPAQIKAFIPSVSLKGENIVKKSENMPWYTGPALLDVLNKLDVPEKPIDLPLRVPIQDAYNITGIGCVPVGKVETGVLKVGQKVIAVPGREGKGVSGEVKTIEMHHQQLPQAVPGDNCGISIRGFNKRDVARGDVIGEAGNAPSVAEEFTAMITVINHPSVVTVGYTPVCHIHTSQVACQFVEIKAKLDPASGAVAEENPDMLRNGDTALVKLKPMVATVIEQKDDIPQLSKFAIRDSGATVAAGVCLKIDKKREL